MFRREAAALVSALLGRRKFACYMHMHMHMYMWEGCTARPADGLSEIQRTTPAYDTRVLKKMRGACRPFTAGEGVTQEQPRIPLRGCRDGDAPSRHARFCRTIL